MAETLLSFGVQKLWDLIVQESERFKGVDEQFTELRNDVMLLRSFLKDADAKQHDLKTVKSCVEEIKEIVLDAEDIIETFTLKEELRKTNGIKKHMRRLSCITVDRREVVSDIGGISKRISKVICNMEKFGVISKMIVEAAESSHPLRESLKDIRTTFPRNSESNLVGLEENVDKLVGYLVKDDSSQMVAITGMGGIGKTTLARQAFNDARVKKHFSGLAWVCLSQDFKRENLWDTIFQKLSSKHDEQRDSNKSTNEVQSKLFRLLETSKSLIVLDDMWKEEDWDKLKDAFPSKKRVKIILTSRNERVALHADPTCVIIKPQYLSSQESWTLFQRIAFPFSKDTEEYKVHIEMEKMGKQMIKHCEGLPLALKVLGGLLAARHTLPEWKRVCENIKSHIVGGTSFNDRNINSVYYILYLSFEELPNYLKHSFLYLAHFPEDYIIDVGMLSYLWAADGIPRPRNYKKSTYQGVGDEYIEELVKRNMVISERDELTSKFKTCRLHDMMREVCLLKAEEENFVHNYDKSAPTLTSQSPCKSRRLFIDSDHIPVNINGCIRNPKLRSFMAIYQNCRHLVRMGFTRLQLMRVLDLSYATFYGGKVPSSIGKLIHLRYLNLYKSTISHLPYSMRNLKKLLYLNLRVRTTASAMYVPNLSKMQELAYLYLPRGIHYEVKMELGNLVNLETLKNFSTKNSSLKDLHQMTKLETLSIRWRGRCTMKTLSLTLSKLRHVENLTIHDDKVFDRTSDREFVLDCNHLKQLKLCIYMPKLPDEKHFPTGLTTIHLNKCCLKEDPMPILEKLLELKEVTLSFYSYCGRSMICSSGGFPQLRRLTFSGLVEWEEWIVKEGSMPLLHTLSIDNCQKFKQLPDGLQFSTSLQTLKLIIPPRNTREEWKERLSKRGEDYYKVKHIPLVEIR